MIKTQRERERVTLGDFLILLESGKRPSTGSESFGIPSIGAEKIEGIGIYNFSKEYYLSEDFYTKMRKGHIINSDVLLYKDGAYCGKTSMVLNDFPYEKCAVNEHVFIMRTKGMQYWLYCYLRQDGVVNELKTRASGKAAQPGLNQSDVRSMSCCIPNHSRLTSFNAEVTPLFDKIVENAKETQTLTTLRQTLLPRLISDELDAAKIETI